jgi:hypothetical protein
VPRPHGARPTSCHPSRHSSWRRSSRQESAPAPARTRFDRSVTERIMHTSGTACNSLRTSPVAQSTRHTRFCAQSPSNTYGLRRELEAKPWIRPCVSSAPGLSSKAASKYSQPSGSQARGLPTRHSPHLYRPQHGGTARKHAHAVVIRLCQCLPAREQQAGRGGAREEKPGWACISRETSGLAPGSWQDIKLR